MDIQWGGLLSQLAKRALDSQRQQSDYDGEDEDGDVSMASSSSSAADSKSFRPPPRWQLRPHADEMRDESDNSQPVLPTGRQKRPHADASGWNSSFGNSWSQLCTGITTQLADIRQREIASRRVVSRASFVTNPMRGVDRVAGDDVLLSIARTLDSFGIIRTPTQKLFHFWFTQAILPRVYGEEWDTSATRVLRKFGVTRTRTEVMVMTPRRFGKTWSVAMFVVAVLLSVPGIKIAIFSTGKRASSSLMKIALEMLGKIKGATRRICKETSEELSICTQPLSIGKSATSNEARAARSLSTTSHLHSYPGGSSGKQVHTYLYVHTHPWNMRRGGWNQSNRRFRDIV